jgi:hypothetical protein
MTIITGDKIRRTSFSPRNPIFFVRDWSDKQIERQPDQRGEKSNQDNTNDLEAETMGSIDDIFCCPYDSYHSQENKKNSNDIHPESNPFCTKQRS